MSKDTLSILATLTPEQINYLARLVDEDTTGNQDDALYLLLMEAYHLCSEREVQ